MESKYWLKHRYVLKMSLFWHKDYIIITFEFQFLVFAFLKKPHAKIFIQDTKQLEKNIAAELDSNVETELPLEPNLIQCKVVLTNSNSKEYFQTERKSPEPKYPDPPLKPNDKQNESTSPSVSL